MEAVINGNPMETNKTHSITGPTSELPPSLPAGIDGLHAVAGRPNTLPASPPTPSTSPDAMGLIKAFQRRWRLAVGLAAVGAVIAAAAAWFLVPPAKYTAEALLLVEPEQPKLIAATKEYRSDPETDRRTQVTLIKSPVVLGKALSQPEVTQLEMVRRKREPSEWLEGEIKAEFTGKILRVSLTGDKPTDVATLVRSVTNAYLSEVVNKEKAERLERNEVLKRHYDKLQQQLDTRRNRLRNLTAEVGSNDKQTMSLQQRMAITRQGMAEQELLKTQADLKRAMAELKVLEAKTRRDDPVEPAESPIASRDVDVERTIQTDPVMQGYYRREEELKGVLQDALRIARNQADPSIVTAQRELKKLRDRIKKYEVQLRSEHVAAKANPPEARKAESSLASLQDEIDVLTELQSELQDEVSRFTGDTKKLGSQSVEIESIKDEIGSAMNIAKMIGDEVETLKIELSAPDRVRVLKEAKAPMAVDMSKRIKFTGMAAGGALVAIILLISFWEVRARKIDSQDDVIRGLGIKVVGTMPAIPRAASRSHSKLSGPQGQLWQYQLSESVETTRIMLMHAARVASYRLVLVTSAVGGEGKTSLSSHLATSLARSGQRTLLIDGDLRRPMVHRLYDQPREPGLCELVRDEAGADAVIRPTAIENLWIIPSGRFDDQALAVLSQTRIRAVFDHLREKFDFVIVDSAPVLPVADTLLLCQHVDAALFSVLRDVSQLPKVQAAYQRIASLEVPILGAVVSGTEVVSDYRYAEWS